jgi:hypothetical protein
MSKFNEGRLQQVLKGLAGREQPQVVVETGTFEAQTTRLFERFFPIVHTIELQPLRWRDNFEKRGQSQVQFHLGDSAHIVKLLAEAYHDVPVFWFLDAHWFQFDGELPVAESEFPLWKELDAIRARSQPDIVVVDDVHAFGRPGPEGWADVSRESIDKWLDNRHSKSLIYDDQYIAYLTGPSD